MPALDLTVFPSTKLHSLELQQLQATLPTTGTTVSFQGFTQLTRLSLSSCCFSRAAVLTPPPALQELSLQGGLWGSCGSLLGSFLQSDALHGLTKLELQDDSTGFVLSTCLQHVQKLPGLKSLTLTRPLSSSTQDEAAPGSHLLTVSHFSNLSALQHLTDLNISGIGVTEAGPVLAQLSKMQRLELKQCYGLHAAALQGLSQLQHLYLDKVHSMTELLAVLPGLQELTHLSLEGSMLDRAPAAAFTALTASSKLAHLRLAHAVTTQGSGDLWDNVFAPGQELTQLTSLSVKNCSPLPLLTLPGACPNMQQLELSLHEVYGDGAAAGSGSRQVDNGHGQLVAHPMAALQQLTGLTSLALRGGYFAPVSVGVRQLTGLQKLQVSAWYPLGSQDLLGLSNLQQLTSLECAPLSAKHECADSSGFRGPARVMWISNQAPGGFPPDVSLQLQDRVRSCPACNQGTMPGAAAAPARHGSQARTPVQMIARRLLRAPRTCAVSMALAACCAALLLQHFFH